MPQQLLLPLFEQSNHRETQIQRLEEIVFTPDFYQNPYPTYKKLRESGSLHFNNSFGGAGTWLVTRYDCVTKMLNDTRLSAARSTRFFEVYSHTDRQKLFSFENLFKEWIIFLDSPQHEFWRKITTSGFIPTNMKDMRNKIEIAIYSLLDAIKDQCEFDFAVDFSYLFPTHVISLMMGLDPNDCKKLASWADDIANFFGNPGAPIAAAIQAQSAFLSLHEYFQHIIKQRIATRKDDAISLMIQAIDSSSLDANEKANIIYKALPAQCAGLIFAGHKTTGSLFCNGMHGLFSHPDQLDAFIRQPELAMNVVREIVRYDTSAQFVGRIVTEPFVFSLQKLQPGQMVLGLIGSANRDERIFAEPDKFKIDRPNAPPPLAFGSGPHRCLGRYLALMEMEIALRQILTRYPRLAPVSLDVEWNSNFNFRGIRSMRVTTRQG